MRSFLPYIIFGLVNGSVYGLAALGIVVTYRTSGILNFAHGAVAAAGAYAFYQLRQLDHVPWPIALVLSVVIVGAAVGWIFEAIARSLTNASMVARIVASLGVLILLQQLALIHYGVVARSFSPFLPTSTFRLFGAHVGIDQLIVVLIGLGGTFGLTVLLRSTDLGRTMRGVVDNGSLLALSGTSPRRVRRWSWTLGCMFASLSGVLIAPSIGLDASVLTLLVVQAFGAAALGMFTSLPLAYIGGLVLGIGSAISSKYVSSVPILSSIPVSLPFILLFVLLIVMPRGRLVDIAPELRRNLPSRIRVSRPASISLNSAGVLFLILVPVFAGARLTAYSTALPYVVVFLSLILLDRLSGQLSLAQLAFAAVGGTAFSHFTHSFGIPWLIAVLFGALVAVPVGALLAIPASRLSGLYLALASFGFGLLMESMFYGQSYLFGGGTVVAPRPSFARSDRSYYYLLLLVAFVAAALYTAVRRAPLGRLLRATADSPTALRTQGMSTTRLRVIAFCLSSFLAGLGGALLGPVTGELSSAPLMTIPSLQLVVILALQAPLADVPAAFGGAVLVSVVPSYLVNDPGIIPWLPVVFGASAVFVAVRQGLSTTSTSGVKRRIGSTRADRRDPIFSRLEDMRIAMETAG